MTRPRIVRLDGAMGTELIACGLPAGLPPEAWMLARPEVVRAVHEAHAAAGAEWLTACTFGALEPRLVGAGLAARLEELCRTAIRLAREAAGDRPLVAALGPTGLSRPGAPLPAEVEPALRRALRALRAAGAELVWLETHYHPDEARLAVRLAREQGLRVACTVALALREGRLLLPDGGCPIETLVSLAAPAGDALVAIGVNCVDPGPALTALVRRLARQAPVPVAVRPSAGRPGARLSPEEWAVSTAALAEAGAAMLGGCCQAGPAHLRALGARLDAHESGVEHDD